jgi:hypothetical protein
VREGNFAFYHLGDQERLLWERVLAAAGIAAVLALARIIAPLGRRAGSILGALRQDLKTRYAGEIPRLRRGELLRAAALILAVSAAAGLGLALVFRLIALCLPWQDIPSIAELGGNFFGLKTALLRRGDLPSRILFALALIVTGGAGGFITPRRGHGGGGAPADSESQ